MDFFSAELPVGAFAQLPSPLVKPAIDVPTARRIAQQLAQAKRPVIVAGGGVHLARASGELQALAEALEIPLRTRSWARVACPKATCCCWAPPAIGPAGRQRAVPPRRPDPRRGHALQRTDSSSWDPSYTFDIPGTSRLIQIDIDDSEIGRNYPAELGVVADAKQALALITEQGRA